MPLSLSSNDFGRLLWTRRSCRRASGVGDGEGEASGVGLGDDWATLGESKETAGERLHHRDVTAAIAITATNAIIANSTIRRPPENQRRAGSGSKMLSRANFDGRDAGIDELAACT